MRTCRYVDRREIIVKFILKSWLVMVVQGRRDLPSEEDVRARFTYATLPTRQQERLH